MTWPPMQQQYFYTVCTVYVEETGFNLLLCNLPNVDLNLSRRVYTEEKPKVVAAVWGAELINILAALQI